MTAILHAVAALALCASPNPSYAWPLDLPQIVTGTFGEYRAGRFHAGVDLHTGGIGQPVHAPADGHVLRVSCSPWGYGKAVHLQLDDGNMVVFGHLSGFAPALSAYVRKVQHERKKYSVDLTPEPGAFRLKRGEVVAFSGDTGIGGAHLHYEIRDPQGCPINPRTLGVTWPDTTPPVAHRLLIVPGDPGSTVNGDVMPAVLELRAGPPGHYTCERVRMTGRIGFGLDTIDPANQGASKLGVYRLRTLVDGEEIFKIQMDRFSYDNRDNELVSYYPFLIDEGQFLLQWRWPGNVCDIFKHSSGDGWLSAPEKSAEVSLLAEDYDGNKLSVSFQLERDTRTAPPAPAKRSAGSQQGKIDVSWVGTWLVLNATFPGPEPEMPDLTVEGGEGAFRRINDTTFRAPIAPAKDAREMFLRVRHDRLPPFEQRYYVFQRGAGDRSIEVDGVTLNVKSDSPYGTLFLRAFPAQETPVTPLPMHGTALRLWPAIMPVNKPFELTFPAPDGLAVPARAAIYRYTGSYWMAETTRREGNTLSVATNHLGAFAVLEDNKPPSITSIVPERGAALSGKRPAIHAKVSDIGSGIADASVTCNGQWLLMAYDPDRNMIEWEKDEDLPEGPKEFVFTVSDGAGNTTTVTRTCPLAAPKPAAAKPSQPTHKKKPKK